MMVTKMKMIKMVKSNLMSNLTMTASMRFSRLFGTPHPGACVVTLL